MTQGRNQSFSPLGALHYNVTIGTVWNMNLSILNKGRYLEKKREVVLNTRRYFRLLGFSFWAANINHFVASTVSYIYFFFFGSKMSKWCCTHL